MAMQDTEGNDLIESAVAEFVERCKRDFLLNLLIRAAAAGSVNVGLDGDGNLCFRRPRDSEHKDWQAFLEAMELSGLREEWFVEQIAEFFGERA